MDTYYDDIYDIQFRARDSYVAKAGPSSVTIGSDGKPVWDTWQGRRSARDGRWLFNQLGQGNSMPEGVIRMRFHMESDYRLLALILCEDAYRQNDFRVFRKYNRLLSDSSDTPLRLKAAKMNLAWSALQFLGGPVTEDQIRPPLEKMIQRALIYLATRDEPEANRFSAADFKVEKPVHSDWLLQGADIERSEDRERFYASTFSYIPELVAANGQVETLFNYECVLKVLREHGVKSIYDYAAGIGTFAALAHTHGMTTTCADIESQTATFAQFNLSKLGVPAKFETLPTDWRQAQLPDDMECIVCTELLEHIDDPHGLVLKFRQALKPGGVLVVSESFNCVKEFCTHLPKHYGKGGAVFLEFLAENGFQQIPTIFPVHPTVHLRL